MHFVSPKARMGVALALAALEAPPMSEEERKVYKSRIAAEYAKHKPQHMFGQLDMFRTTMKMKA